MASVRAVCEHAFAHLKNWRIITKLRRRPVRDDAAAGAARADQHRSRTLTDDLGSRQPPASSTSTRSLTHTSPADLRVRSWRRLNRVVG
ncbi:hypothetical protein [Streptomyces himalayensis]|uniref:hypothetical protein n=1 Tax=Streptomyces himalayensis TaxID=2820085 RepID=UPI0028682C4C|nr:hypothetical protein [Streptomyces himalayensis]